MYSCQRCGHQAKNKGNLKRHLEKRKPCEAVLPNAPSIGDHLQMLTGPGNDKEKMKEKQDTTQEASNKQSDGRVSKEELKALKEEIGRNIEEDIQKYLDYQESVGEPINLPEYDVIHFKKGPKDKIMKLTLPPSHVPTVLYVLFE